jgi:hypothetical protein
MEGRSTIDWLQLLCRAFGSSREKHVWCWTSNEFSLIKILLESAFENYRRSNKIPDASIKSRLFPKSSLENKSLSKWT